MVYCCVVSIESRRKISAQCAYIGCTNGVFKHDYYRQPCVATRLLCFATVYFILFYFFIHRSFSETTRPILTKFSGIVYSDVF